MSFTEKNTKTISDNQSSGGIGDTIANFAPLVLLGLEQFTGKPIPQLKGTLADITQYLQRLDAKIDNLENKTDELRKDCAEQFTLQEKQLNSLQQVSKLVSTEKTKAIHFANKQITQLAEED